jgi:hypothetical protein
MKQNIRIETFETNSSSTHNLSIKNYKDEHYTTDDKKLIIHFIDTDEESVLTTLHEKVSYLVSQIINRYKWETNNYQNLKELVEDSWDFKRLKYYIKEKFDKDLMLPDTYAVNPDYYDEDDCVLSEIVNINHQLYSESLDECLRELVTDHDLLEDVLSENTYIEFGRD